MAGDVPKEQTRRALHRVADMIADYLEGSESYPVLPRVEPGEVAARLPPAAPDRGEDLDRILDDYQDILLPGLTHWNHPGFMAYFANSASAPGVLGEALAAAVNNNAMLWRTGPASTELEERVCDWLRQMLDLPESFRGHINDTASMGSFLSLAAARHRAAPEVRSAGLFDGARLRVYTSDQAHSSIDKAMIGLGLGLDSLRRIPSDADFRLDPAALAQAIEEDLVAGLRPIAVSATAGTTSTAAIDPLQPIASLCERHGLWFHVDAAYAGSAAICPEYRALMAGIEHADSVVVNPHKWLFTPMDCSVLLVRDPAELKAAFSVVPAYLQTAEGETTTNLMDFGVQLGRRFRSLKLWMVIRAFGVEGLRERIREHCRLAESFGRWVEETEGFELITPVRFALAVFRATGTGSDEGDDRLNAALMEAINAEGRFFLSHNVIGGRTALRMSVGNIHTAERHVDALRKTLVETAARLRTAG